MRRWSASLLLAIAIQTIAPGISAQRVPACAFSTRTDEIGNGAIVYNVAGKGDPVLLIHGLFANKEQWNDVLCRVADSGRTAIAIDLPGYGKSRGFALPEYDLDRQVDKLREMTQRLGLDRIDIAGNSMGGAIAALYASRYPEQVRSLAFIGAPFGIVGWTPAFRDAINHGINPFIPVDERQLDLELELLYVKPPPLTLDERQHIVEIYSRNNLHYVQIWNIVNLSAGALVGMTPAPMPTLILWGEDDKVFGVAGAHQLASAYPGSEVRRLPGAGHLPQVENGADIGPVYLEFLAKLPPHPDPASVAR